jgi:hypothetical protein
MAGLKSGSYLVLQHTYMCISNIYEHQVSTKKVHSFELALEMKRKNFKNTILVQAYLIVSMDVWGA